MNEEHKRASRRATATQRTIKVLEKTLELQKRTEAPAEYIAQTEKNLVNCRASVESFQSLAQFWQANPALTPRQLRAMNPDNYSLGEAQAMAAHCWLCAPAGWKAKVLNRLAELEAAQISTLKA